MEFQKPKVCFSRVRIYERNKTAFQDSSTTL